MLTLLRRRVVFLQLFMEDCGVFQALHSVLDPCLELVVELLTSPLDAVLNHVGEVFERAERDFDLRLILAITVGLSDARDNHLRVGFGA